MNIAGGYKCFTYWYTNNLYISVFGFLYDQFYFDYDSEGKTVNPRD